MNKCINIEYYLSKLIKKLHFKSIKNSDVDRTAKVCAGTSVYKSKIGKYSYTGYNCSIIHAEVGNFCSFGSDIKIGGASHPIEWASSSTVFCGYKQIIKKKFAKHDYDPSAKTVIGNDVWIADNAVVKAGVKIGDGAVIGTSAVVTKNIGPYEIWAGNPAKFIRKRFDDETIFRLLNTEWWYCDETVIEKAGKYVKDVEKFVKFFEESKI